MRSLTLLFFLSGICGLVYQTLWLRLLSLVFGVTIYAASTVLASFMAGLAVGTLIAGRIAGRLANPLAWFGAVELAIGVTACATPWALDAVSAVWLALQGTAAHPALQTATRFVLSFVVLLVPTMFMGATLPLVLRSSLSRHVHVGPRVGLLYGANTAGAIVGAVLAGFVLVQTFGISTTFLIMACVNVSVGLAALALSRAWPMTPAAQGADVAPDAHMTADDDRNAVSPGWIVPAVFAVSGAASLALEIVWFRVLVLFVAATTYAFTSMLATVLLGLALGSLAASALLRRDWSWPHVLGLLQIGIGFSVLGAIAAMMRLYRDGIIGERGEWLSAVAILLPSLLMGVAFPVGIRVATASWRTTSAVAATRRVARLYALNVAGGIVGSVLAGFLLMPALGSRASFILLAASYIASGSVVLLAAKGRRTAAWAVIAGAVAALAWTAVSLPSPFEAVQGRRVPAGERPFWLEEGNQTTVGVYSRPMGGRVLYLDGLHQANDSGPMVRLHSEIGVLPAAVHGRPRRALVIGLGGGVTAGALSQVADLQVDVVELSDSVVRGARWFRHVNHDIHARPNVRFVVDDGRNFLLTTPYRYDLITADIIQPVHAGAGSLYSVEYFRLARRVLAPGGVMLQWIGTRPRSQYHLIARTFLEVFPHATLWADGQLLLGGLEPLRLNREIFEASLALEANRRAFEAIGLRTFEDLQARFTAGPDSVRAFVGDGPLLTDDLPAIEFFRSLPRDEPLVDLSSLRDDVRRWVEAERSS